MDFMVNYRPISLLITLSKLLEKVIYTRLYSFLEHNGMLFASQYGFRSKHSCKQPILEFVGHILQAKNRGEHTASVFLDLSKAFDTLDHSILLSKLKRYGVKGTPLEWFKDYLKDRSLIAKVTTGTNQITYSDKYDITYGTAQGLCLGPLLFIIFINDIHLLPLYSNSILFAGDKTIFNSHKSSQFLKYIVEHDIQLLVEWFKSNKLSFNLSKTVVMKFWSSNASFNINVDGYAISFVTHTKFLGANLDNELSLNQLIEKIQNNKCLFILGRNLLDNHSLKNIYYAHIHSHLIYAIMAWGSMASPLQIK